MFTNKKAKYYGDDKVLLDSACLSTDTKPTTGVANGSKLLEMDTSTVYAFDEANGEWLAQSSSGGGGGGGGGAEPLVVIRTFDSDTESYTYGDTTFGEVRQAFESGKPVIIKTEEGATTNYDLVDGVSYTIESGNCSGSVMWYNGNVGVYGNDSTATLEELDVIILGTSLE